MKKLISTLIIIIGIISCTAIGFATEDNPNSVGYYDIQFKTTTLGNYKVEITASETPYYETLPLDKVPQLKDKLPTAEWTGYTEVSNLPPTARYGSPLEKIKVDVAFATGSLQDFNDFQNNISHFESILTDPRYALDVKVQYVETVTGGFDINAVTTAEILANWKQWPNPNRFTAQGTSLQSNGSSQGFTLDTVINTGNKVTYEADLRAHSSSLDHACGFVCKWDKTKDSAIFVASGNTATCAYWVEGVSKIWSQGWSGTGLLYTSDVTTGAGQIMASCNGAKITCLGVIKYSAENRFRHTIFEIDNKQFKLTSDSLTTTGTIPELNDGVDGVFCSCTGWINNLNISFEAINKKTIVDSISDVNWRDDAYRFIIHATEEVPLEMQPGHDPEYIELVTYLLGGNIYLYNIGLDHINKECFDKLGDVLKNSQGEPMSTYIRKSGVGSGIVTAMNKAAQDIIDKLSRNRLETDWVLVNTNVDWRIAEFSDSEYDPPLNFGRHDGTSKYNAYDKDELQNILKDKTGVTLTSLRYTDTTIQAERWRFRHFETFFDNDLGKASYSGAWIEDAPGIFDKTGKYRINYQRKDNPFYPNMELSYVFNSYRQWSTNYNDD